MRRWAGGVWALIVAAGFIGYQLLVHSAIMDGQPGYLRIALACVPLIALAFWAMRYARHARLWTLFLLVAAVTVYAIEHQAGLGLAAAYGIPHAAVYLSLSWMFGRTLVAAREPLITGFARRIHGSLPPEMDAYTRHVTIAWCVFFIAQPVISAVLLAWAPLDAWSFFVNVLNLPLVVAMFAAEYLYRVTRYRHFPHASILKGVQMFTEHQSLPGGSGDGS
jgi:uncharacterized membrane protein